LKGGIASGRFPLRVFLVLGAITFRGASPEEGLERIRF
jgi:hypothetical protein